MSDDYIPTSQITITSVIDGDGQLTVRVLTPPRFSAVELLGMLEIAKSQIFHDLEARRYE